MNYEDDGVNFNLNVIKRSGDKTESTNVSSTSAEDIRQVLNRFDTIDYGYEDEEDMAVSPEDYMPYGEGSLDISMMGMSDEEDCGCGSTPCSCGDEEEATTLTFSNDGSLTQEEDLDEIAPVVAAAGRAAATGAGKYVAGKAIDKLKSTFSNDEEDMEEDFSRLRHLAGIKEDDNENETKATSPYLNKKPRSEEEARRDIEQGKGKLKWDDELDEDLMRMSKLAGLKEAENKFYLVHDPNGDSAFLVDDRSLHDLIELIHNDLFPEGNDGISTRKIDEFIQGKKPETYSSEDGMVPVSVDVYNISNQEAETLLKYTRPVTNDEIESAYDDDLDEDAEFDYRDENSRPNNADDYSYDHDIISFARKGHSKKQNKIVNNYGDNPLPDPDEEVFESTMMKEWEDFKREKITDDIADPDMYSELTKSRDDLEDILPHVGGKIYSVEDRGNVLTVYVTFGSVQKKNEAIAELEKLGFEVDENYMPNSATAEIYVKQDNMMETIEEVFGNRTNFNAPDGRTSGSPSGTPVENKAIEHAIEYMKWNPDIQKATDEAVKKFGAGVRSAVENHLRSLSKTDLQRLQLKDSVDLGEKAPKGWEKTVKSMKKHKDIDNPYALSHWMKNKGYKSRK